MTVSKFEMLRVHRVPFRVVCNILNQFTNVDERYSPEAMVALENNPEQVAIALSHSWGGRRMVNPCTGCKGTEYVDGFDGSDNNTFTLFGPDEINEVCFESGSSGTFIRAWYRGGQREFNWSIEIGCPVMQDGSLYRRHYWQVFASQVVAFCDAEIAQMKYEQREPLTDERIADLQETKRVIERQAQYSL